jgi:hypothetical protein
MSLKGLAYVGFFIFSYSCSEKSSVPDNVLSPKKFEAVFKDIVIADALTAERSYKDTAVKISNENARYFLKVYELHGVTKNQFMVSYNYYLSRPDLLKVMTDSVSAQLTRKSEKLSTDTSKPNPNGDNIKKAGTGARNK